MAAGFSLIRWVIIIRWVAIIFDTPAQIPGVVLSQRARCRVYGSIWPADRAVRGAAAAANKSPKIFAPPLFFCLAPNLLVVVFFFHSILFFVFVFVLASDVQRRRHLGARSASDQWRDSRKLPQSLLLPPAIFLRNVEFFGAHGAPEHLPARVRGEVVVLWSTGDFSGL